MHNQQMEEELPWSQLDDSSEAREEAKVRRRERMAQNAEWERQAPADRHRRDGRGARHAHPDNALAYRGGLADAWFLDDGTIIALPELVVSYLEGYHKSIRVQGGKRNFSKTIVTLYASEAEIAAREAEWRLAEMKDLCTVVGPGASGKTLGIALGGAEKRVAAMRTKADIVQRMHDRIRRIQNTCAEHMLANACLGVAKVTHMLRAHGDELVSDGGAIEQFERATSGTLARLVPGLNETGRNQARLGVQWGGTGDRSALDVALPAVVASRVMARPKVEQLDNDLAWAGLLRSGQLLGEHDRVSRLAETKLVERLDGPEARQVPDLAQQAAQSARLSWQNRMHGTFAGHGGSTGG